MHIQYGKYSGVPTFEIHCDYGDHHNFIHGDRNHGVTTIGHYNPVIRDRGGFLTMEHQREFYPMTIGDPRILELYYDNKPMHPKLLTEVFKNVWIQLGIVNRRIAIEKTGWSRKTFKDKIKLVFLQHTDSILPDAMRTENYIQNVWWWQKRDLWANFIRFHQK